MTIRRLTILLTLASMTLATTQAQETPAKVTFSQEEDGVTIRVDGELFTRYLTKSGPRPVLWPLIGPTGKEVTRAYPVADAREGEADDHPHHRSVWVAYEGLNGINFWAEHTSNYRHVLPLGEEQHSKFSKLEVDGDTVVLVAENDWVAEEGPLVCTGKRTLRFGAEDDHRWIDYQIELIASAGSVEIGDSKEGVFAIRVAPSMRVDKGLGGRIITSRGKTDLDAWSTRAEWVDYHGPLGDETVGIAILCHPSSFEPTPRWHVRTYGLFASNPFGELAFTDPESEMLKRPLKMTLAAGKTLLLRYRVLMHRGDEKQACIAEKFASYAKSK